MNGDELFLAIQNLIFTPPTRHKTELFRSISQNVKWTKCKISDRIIGINVESGMDDNSISACNDIRRMQTSSMHIRCSNFAWLNMHKIIFILLVLIENCTYQYYVVLVADIIVINNDWFNYRVQLCN